MSWTALHSTSEAATPSRQPGHRCLAQLKWRTPRIMEKGRRSPFVLTQGFSVNCMQSNADDLPGRKDPESAFWMDVAGAAFVAPSRVDRGLQSICCEAAVRCLACRRAARAHAAAASGPRTNPAADQTRRLRALALTPPTAETLAEVDAALQSKWWSLRIAAIETLGRWGGPEQVAQLEALVAAAANPGHLPDWKYFAAVSAGEALALRLEEDTEKGSANRLDADAPINKFVPPPLLLRRPVLPRAGRGCPAYSPVRRHREMPARPDTPDSQPRDRPHGQP